MKDQTPCELPDDLREVSDRVQTTAENVLNEAIFLNRMLFVTLTLVLANFVRVIFFTP